MPKIYEFELGVKEKHKIQIYKSLLFYKIKLLSDGKKVEGKFTKKGRKKDYIFEVGNKEIHKVMVSMDYKTPFDPRLLMWHFYWDYTIFVDGKKIVTFVRY